MKKPFLRRLPGLMLTILLLLTFNTAALAADMAAVSTQKLSIDGTIVPVTAYNIQDSNYLKLRDVAWLLRDTPARFSVEYAAETNSIHIVTGEAYTANGAEMQPIGTEEKAAVKSVQTLYINGRKYSSLSAYNIDDFNYFKLRDLGGALGFKVDYDEESRTMLILTTEGGPVHEPAELPADWAPDFSFTTTDMEGGVWTETCFAGHDLTVMNLWAYWCGPCVREMPDLEQLARDYADRGVQMLGVYFPEDEAEDMQKVRELGITYPCLRYAEELDPYLDTGYIPVTIFVDGNGKVLGEAFVGSRNYAAWASIIEGYLQ